MTLVVPEVIVCLLLCSMVAKADRVGVQRRAENEVLSNPTQVRAPLSVPISQWFEGNDGPWSTFQLSAGNGNQAKSVRLLPSTSLPETYLVVPMGCEGVASGQTFDNDRGCAESRGGVYNFTNSNTYTSLSMYKPGAYQTFSDYGQKDFTAKLGFEELSFGLPRKSGVGVKRTNMFGFADYIMSWTGLLGIDPRPSFFEATDGFNAPQPNLVQRLNDTKQIPSVSWAYTAGSYWRRAGGIPGSLVLGGYDSLRFQQNNVTFPMNTGDEEKALKIALQSIELKGATTTRTLPFDGSVRGQTILATIDSTRPYFYLPQWACDTIAQEFKLTWDQTTEHYLISNSSYSYMTSAGVSLTVKMGTAPESSSPSVSITLPQTSLILRLGFPYFAKGNETQRYFPMKPAASENQYSLGRALLQDAYLIADYERKSFSIHKVIDPPLDGKSLLKAIHPPSNASGTFEPLRKSATNGTDLVSSKPTTGAIAGVVAGSVVTILLAILTIILFYLRRRRTRAQQAEATLLKRQEEAAAAAAAAAADKLESQTDSGLSTSVATSATLSPANTVHGRLVEADSAVVHESGGEALPKPPDAPVELPDSSGSVGGFYWKDGEMLHEMQGTPVPPPSEGTRSGDSTLYGPPPSGLRHLYAPGESRPPAYSVGALSVPGSSHRPGSPPPASPIPQTPLEFYGPVRARGPTGPTRVREDAGSRGWVGRAPGLPQVTLTPATPVSPSVARTTVGQLLQPVNERRPPVDEKSWPQDEKK